MRGKVLFVSPAAPWGFIAPEFHEDGRSAVGSPDIFFHLSGCLDQKLADLQPGLLVEYAESRRNNKPIAINVKRYVPQVRS